MPYYNFVCRDCEHAFLTYMKYEEYQDKVRCPQCLYGVATRRIEAPRLITQPHWLRPENDIRQHVYGARDDKELLEAIKADEKAAAIEADHNAERRKQNPIKADDPYPDVVGFEEYAAMGYTIPTVAEAKRIAAKGA